MLGLRPSGSSSALQDEHYLQATQLHSSYPKPSAPSPSPRRNSLFWGLHTRRPASPAGPGLGVHSTSNSTRALTSQTRKSETGSSPFSHSELDGASLENSDGWLSLILTHRVPDKECADGIPLPCGHVCRL